MTTIMPKFAAILTYDDKEDILEQAYCGFPITNFSRAKQVDYVLIAYNRRNNENPNKTLSNGEGFLLIKPIDVEKHQFPEKDKDGNDKIVERKSFHFNEYAEISIKNAWRELTGGIQSITYYDNADEYSTMQAALNKLNKLEPNFNFDNLEWKTVQKSSKSLQDNLEKSEESINFLPVPEVIKQAKTLIFEKTGIPVEKITINFSTF